MPPGSRWTYYLRVAPHYLLPVLTALCLCFLALLVGLRLRRHQPPTLPSDRLIVTVLNVGQGEATWIRTPGGRFLLIGGGPPGQGNNVAQSLRNANARRIEELILPYPYAEAMGGLPDVIKQFPVVRAWEQGGAPINQWQEQVRTSLSAARTPIQPARAGQEIIVDGVRIEILAPAEPLLKDSPVAANNSVVVRITFGNTRFLWAGGLDKRGEVALLTRTSNVGANWLRVARFATNAASSPEFLRLVCPEIAVVSVGPNRSGLPHPDTMNRLTATGAVVYRTDTQTGPLQFISNGETITGPN